MIEYRKGNLLDVTEGVIIHGCNMQGVMGSGVALAIKNKYPLCYDLYKEHVSKSYSELGNTIFYTVNEKLTIVNALTQENYGKDGRRYVNYAAIFKVFDRVLNGECRNGDVVHFPKIGAGLGGGNWNFIEQIINDTDPKDRVKKICWEL